MSIPKIIHYCWFGGAPLPRLAEKCLKSWKKHCPDYEIRLWNEENFDLNENRYVREAASVGKWAFVSDYVRLKVVLEHGGIYLDTDVELLKSLDSLLEEKAFFGLDERDLVCTGLGFGAEKGSPLVAEMLRDYDEISFFLPEGKPDLTPCPDRNTEALSRLGWEKGAEFFEGARFLGTEYLCPLNWETGEKRMTENTLSIHHYAASWTDAVAKRTTFLKRLLGVKLYCKIYGKFFRNCKWLEW